jgi:hypothetical protein
MAADILEKILAVKREEVAAGKAVRPLAAMRAEAEAQAPARLRRRNTFKSRRWYYGEMRGGDRRNQEGQPVQGRDPCRFPPGGDRRRLRERTARPACRC